ncbi:hypothetical protein BACCIP111895_04621 [Neobacillus rhizosphaerae]|uniref:DUF2325 domain-containing protein n=1 Tax=Neobacillus rhizosphaerae TaxID=2880965 RepID=A0ABM9EXL8_9BACI|nr:DUF2968 domain-containing protein [Neobacillus rhizosphaerae]CAH2717429.1 hypothetical protein BACCIP111895_04621 [Neobacillus rhizosphaerae]
MSYQKDILPHEQNILHQFLSIALGGNSYLHPLIENCYKKKEWEYYEAFQRSGLKGNPLFSMYTTKSEEKIRQVAGMVEWCYQNHQFAQLDQLIKKGYKFVYQYLHQHAQIDFEHFIRAFATRQKSKTVKEIELFYQNIVLWYLCVRENKPFNTKNVTWLSFQEVLHSVMNEIKLEEINFSNQMVEKHKEEIDDLYEEYNIPKNLCFDSLGSFLEYLIGISLKKIYESNPYCDAEKAQQQVFQESPAKYIGALGGWLKTLKIQELDATEQMPFTKRDLDMVFLELLYAKKYNHITKDEQDLFFMTCLYLKCLSSHYRETKLLYLDQSKQDYYLEMKSKETRIIEGEVDLLRRQQQWQLTNKRQQKDIEGLTQELREAQARIRQLENQIENMEDYTHEVHALRNFVYWEEQADNNFDRVPSLKTMTEFIQSKRIVIFGGYLNWQQKLKELLPTVEFVDVNEMNRDITRIHRVDAVFINTTVFAHAFYKKIMKELSKTETPLFYLNGQSNIEKTTLEIYKWLIE